MLKTARNIMEFLEENKMTLFPDETNQINLYNNQKKLYV